MQKEIKILLSETPRHPKVIKNEKYAGVYTKILHLAPANRSGYEVCPMRSKGCTEACLNTAGFHYTRKEAARIKRTRLFFEDREKFMNMLYKEIKTARASARRKGLDVGIRLNGTSDIPWETVGFTALAKTSKRTYDMEYRNIMAAFPDVMFMDYTKRPNRKNLPKNYRLVFSRSEDNEEDCLTALKNKMNVAIVFDGAFPEKWNVLDYHNIRVIDGDEHDWRYGDYDEFPDERVIVGLKAKGKAIYDTTGFVIHTMGVV